MISPEELAWRQRTLAQTRYWAKVQMPKIFRSVHSQRLQPIDDGTPPAIAAVAAPETPIPETRLPETGGMRRLDTAMISAVKLLKPRIRDTTELVSSAVQWFWELNYGCLPTVVSIHPLRYMALGEPLFLALDDRCAEIGCYLIEIRADPHLPDDGVYCLKRDVLGCYWGGKTDYYL